MIVNNFRVSKRWSASEMVARQTMKISLAKNRWLTVGPFLEICAPRMRPCCSFRLSRWERISMEMINSDGDSWSPYRMPLDDRKEPTWDPLRKNANLAVEIQLEMRFVQRSLNSRCLRASRIVCQLIMSKAFGRSSLMAIRPCFFFLNRIIWMISWEIMTLLDFGDF